MTCAGVTWPGREQSVKLEAGLQAHGGGTEVPQLPAQPAGGTGPSLALGHQTHSTGDASSEPLREGVGGRTRHPRGLGKGS